MTEREIERWTREVADDPGAPSFVDLARAYRAQGRRDAARDVVLQGLEERPEHVRAHALLALIYVEDGEREKAGDEWQIALRLEPGNFDANRGLGFLALERGDLRAARRHLEAAAEARPDDSAVGQAMEVLERREAARGSRPTVGSHRAGARDPSRLFDELADESLFLGGVVLDAQGLIVAGRIEPDGGRNERLGALINTAVEEARRATDVLGLGGWEGLRMDCDDATLHVAGLPDDAVVLLAVESGAPAGWSVRTADRARRLARRFVERRYVGGRT